RGQPGAQIAAREGGDHRLQVLDVLVGQLDLVRGADGADRVCAGQRGRAQVERLEQLVDDGAADEQIEARRGRGPVAQVRWHGLGRQPEAALQVEAIRARRVARQRRVAQRGGRDRREDRLGERRRRRRRRGGGAAVERERELLAGGDRGGRLEAQ